MKLFGSSAFGVDLSCMTNLLFGKLLAVVGEDLADFKRGLLNEVLEEAPGGICCGFRPASWGDT